VAGHKLHAVKYGVPQKRKRVVIVGTLEGDPETFFPKPLICDEKKYITTQNAIGDLFNVEVSDQHNPIKITSKPTHFFQKFVRGLLSPQQYFKLFR
jgi:site-specific DNA-cytosine methylase